MLFCVDAYAQYNDTVNYYVGATATGSINKTNDASSYLLNNGLKLGIRKRLYSLNATNTWVYGAQEAAPAERPTLTNNDYTSTLDLNVCENLSHLYYWGLANYMSSYSLKVNNQLQAGAGIAYKVIDHKMLKLNLSDGILFERSDIYLADSTRDRYSTYRNSFRLLFKWIVKDIFTLNTGGFYQNSFSSGSDYIIKYNCGLDIKVKKWLHFTTLYTYNRFNRTKQENTLFTYGLTIDKYF